MAESVDELLEQLWASRERLLAVVAGVGEEQFKRRPETQPATGAHGEGWSIAELLAHLLGTERQYAARIARALEEDGARVETRSPEEEAEEARRGRAVPVPQLIHGLLASRRDVERRLQAHEAPDALEHAVLGADGGRETVASMLREGILAHEREHTAQIEAVKAALGAKRPEAAGNQG